MKAVRCPVCAGTGTYWVMPDEEEYSADVSVGSYRACHGCGGKGWVEVHDEQANPCNATVLLTYPGIAPPEGWPEPGAYSLQGLGPNLYVTVY